MLDAGGENTQLFTPYGATECLPVACIDGATICAETGARYREGAGTCIGTPVANATVRIIAIDDEPIQSWSDAHEVPTQTIGELCVRADQVTTHYHARSQHTHLAKIHDNDGGLWHRMGDCGYYDEKGRLWFCGRKSQRIEFNGITYHTDQVEGWCNNTTDVRRSALVNIGRAESPIPAVVCEPEKDAWDQRTIIQQLVVQRLADHPEFQHITTVFMHPSLPVDIRHNAKIQREKLGEWARQQKQ